MLTSGCWHSYSSHLHKGLFWRNNMICNTYTQDYWGLQLNYAADCRFDCCRFYWHLVSTRRCCRWENGYWSTYWLSEQRDIWAEGGEANTKTLYFTLIGTELTTYNPCNVCYLQTVCDSSWSWPLWRGSSLHACISECCAEMNKSRL